MIYRILPSNFQWGPNPQTVLRGAWTELYQTSRDHRAVIGAHPVCFRFQLPCSVRNTSGSNASSVENRGQISNFL